MRRLLVCGQLCLFVLQMGPALGAGGPAAIVQGGDVDLGVLGAAPVLEGLDVRTPLSMACQRPSGCGSSPGAMKVAPFSGFLRA